MSQRGLRAIRKQLNKPQSQPWVGQLGDAAGTVEVPGRPGLWYVRPKGSDLPVVVQGGAAPQIAGMEVLVGADPYRAGRVRVLGVSPVEGGSITERQSVEAHYASHGPTGSDRVYIASDQVVNGLAYAGTGMTAHVNSGWAVMDGVAVKFAAGDLDLTGSIPATGARWSLIRVSDAGALSVQDGTPVDSLADLGAADVPALAAGYALIAVVRLYDGQTSLSKAVAAPDVIDVRFAPRSHGLPAADVTVDASGFSGNLSTTDTDVQTALETIDAMTSGATDADAIHDNVAGEIAAITAKATPADADLALIEDSADSNAKKRVTLVSILSAIGAALYAPIAKGVTNGDSHDHAGGDGAQVDHGGLGGLTDNDHTQYNCYPACGRLTLETGVAVSKTDQSAKTTLYYTPFRGDKLALYNGSSWDIHTLTADLSLSLAGYTASRPYDIFVYDNAGTPTLESAIWTNATTRATALALQNGVLVKSGAPTRRYLGTILINSSGGQTDRTATFLGLWNYYHRVSHKMIANESTVHSYNGAIRLWNNSEVNNRLEFVIGTAEEDISVNMRASLTGTDGSYAGATLFFNGVATTYRGTNFNLYTIIGGSGGAEQPRDGMNYVNMYEVGNSGSNSMNNMTMSALVWY